MEDGGGVFPLVFFDGENEVNIGQVMVDPSMEYKSFQLTLSQMIGISPNQISIYLIDKKKSPPESRRRVPITAKANFAVISREKDCSFLAVLKRARKNRRSSKPKPDHQQLCSGLVSLAGCGSPADNILLLRRNSPAPQFPEFFHQNPSSEFNDRMWMRDLEFQRWNYNQAVLMSSNPVPDLKSLDCKYLSRMNGGGIEGGFKPRSSSVLTSCEECEKEKLLPPSAAAFHHCVNDAVVFSFWSTAAPIARPAKPL